MFEQTHHAADFVRERLRDHEGPITQEQMKRLIDDLRVAMGGNLTRADVIEIVEAFQGEQTQPG